MDAVIRSVREAIDRDCLIPALFAALTIPDAMGKNLYLNRTKENRSKGIRERYERWFDEWVSQRHLQIPSGAPEELFPNRPPFDGSACWKLRCSLLHSGDYEIDINPEPEDAGYDYLFRFNLTEGGTNMCCSIWPVDDMNRPTKAVDFFVSISSLSTAICDGAEECLSENRGKVRFPDLTFFPQKPFPKSR